MQATRERSLKLMAEKDADILHLRSQLSDSPPSSSSPLPSTPTQLRKNYRRNISGGSVSSLSEQVSMAYAGGGVGGVAGEGLGGGAQEEGRVESLGKFCTAVQ